MIRATAIRIWVVYAALLLGLAPALAHAESNMNRIREKAEEFTAAWTKAQAKHNVEGKKAATDRVLKDFGYLFSATKISDIDDARNQASSEEEKRALLLLRQFIEAQLVAGRVSEASDELNNLELEEESELTDGRSVPFPEVRYTASHEADRRSRKFAHVTVTDKLTIYNVYRNQILVTQMEGAQELGFDSYPAMRSAHQDIDYAQLTTTAEELLQATEGAYEAALDARADPVLGVKRSKVRRYDLDFLTTSPEMDDAVGKQDRKKLWKAVRGPLGLKSNDKIVKTNFKNDAKRSAVDDVYPMDLAKEILIAGREHAPAAQLAADLFALGRLSRLQSLATDQWEFRREADGALDYAAGYLFEGLMAEPAFATSVLGMNDAQAAEMAESRRVAELVALRLDASAFLFSLLLYEDFKLAQTRYTDVMEGYLKTSLSKIDSELYLDDFTFESAERLTGRLLAAQLRDTLKTRFQDEWWKSAEAGKFLKTMWADGSKLSLESMGQQYGFSVFDSSTLAAAASPAME